nr:ATP12 family protein [uncultured Sphingomonas sp.]
MKRFWTSATVEREGEGWTIALDGRRVKTPARVDLIVPTAALAEAIAAEWNDGGEEINPRAMPLTGLANAAVDRVATDPVRFAADLAKYAEADLLCYRADGPGPLVTQQAELWDPLLDWARRRYDVDFVVGDGVLHIAQPAETVKRLAHAVDALDPFRLAGLSPMVTIGGSLVTALAVLEEAVTAEVGWNALSLDDRFQMEKWGADDEAVKALENRERDFLVAARFVSLL